jgi:hypothetical protein
MPDEVSRAFATVTETVDCPAQNGASGQVDTVKATSRNTTAGQRRLMTAFYVVGSRRAEAGPIFQ